MVAEIVAEMDYLRSREQKLRDTNESTNTRVKWFAFSTMGMLVALGAWQVVYLRAYFRYVLSIVRATELCTNRRTDQNISSRYSRYFRRIDNMASWDMENTWLVLLVVVKNRYIMILRAGKNELEVLDAVRQGRARTGICEGVYHEVQEGKYQLQTFPVI
jgi:hypothetical protein